MSVVQLERRNVVTLYTPGMYTMIHQATEQPPITPTETGHNLPLLPLKSVVLLPKSARQIIVTRASSMQAVEYALKHNRAIFVSAQIKESTEHPTIEDIYAVGTRSIVHEIVYQADNTLRVVVEGICRARVVRADWLSPEQLFGAQAASFLQVYCEDVPTTGLDKLTETEPLWRQLTLLYGTYSKLNAKAPTHLLSFAKTIHDVDYLTDAIATLLDLNFNERQHLLEITDLNSRIAKICSSIKRDIDILQTQHRIDGQVQTQMEKNQREFYLNEQLKAIKKELGEDTNPEVQQLRDKVKELKLSAEATEKVEKELKRLETMSPLSAEAVVCRHYIEWIISLPWGTLSPDTISLAQAEGMLDKNHAGLNKAKERIIEFLATQKFQALRQSNDERGQTSNIICLVGPPGVGKTSLGKSIATSLGREFVRISLGGVRDEAEIRGHRRTYIGSLPGKLIHAMRKAKTQNPVILLDEIDKMTSDTHGDPAAALLEVLDPEQNKTFVDHFLDIEYDLSKVMFIATANLIEGIPYPLLDRMEMIQLAGYTEEEKLTIAKKFLIPKNLTEHALKSEAFILSDELLKKIIGEYTKEAGVRQLERVVAKLMRKCIQLLLEDSERKKVTVTEELLKEWLGSPKFKRTSLDAQSNKVGVVTGLAWTDLGGDVLEIEATTVPGKGNITLTGQLGDVMEESAHAALSYIRARAKEFHLGPSFYSSKDIHIHLPDGATPKDGPSAGIAMCTALVSSLTKIPVVNEVAMTGEITLRGRAMAIGGLKEKLLAARRHGIKTVLVPKENFDDIQEILKEIPTDLNIVFVETMDDVLKVALKGDPRLPREKESDHKKKRGTQQKKVGKKIQAKPIKKKRK